MRTIETKQVIERAALCGLLLLLSCSSKPVATSDGNRNEVWRQIKSGYDAFKKGDLDVAMSCAEEALRRDTKQDPAATAKAHVLRSLVCNLRKKHDLAVEEATKAIQVKNDAHYAYFARARAYEWKEEYKKAAGDMTEAIRLTPEAGQQGVYYSFRSKYYRQLGQEEKAGEDERKAKELSKSAGHEGD